jgi:hypothetical protein
MARQVSYIGDVQSVTDAFASARKERSGKEAGGSEAGRRKEPRQPYLIGEAPAIGGSPPGIMRLKSLMCLRHFLHGKRVHGEDGKFSG